jgi:hypothetical protein
MRPPLMPGPSGFGTVTVASSLDIPVSALSPLAQMAAVTTNTPAIAMMAMRCSHVEFVLFDACIFSSPLPKS